MQSDHEIYEEVSADLVRFAAVLVGPDAAHDVVSSVVTRTLTGGPLGRLRDPRAYLMRAVLNESRNTARKRSRADASLARLGPPAQGVDPAEGHYPDLTAAVMELPPRQRAALYLIYWCEMTSSEAATVLNCRPGTVRRYVSLARTKLEEFADG